MDSGCVEEGMDLFAFVLGGSPLDGSVVGAGEPEVADEPEKATIQTRFERFHGAHPEVLEYLLKFAREFKASGRTKCSIELLWIRMRWYIAIEKDEQEIFKLNDHYRSRYARLIMDQFAEEFGHFFEVRELRTA